MGQEQSTPANPIFIGEGLYGAVYLLSDGQVLKKGKLKKTYPFVTDDNTQTDLWREMQAYDWIDSIESTGYQQFFARRSSIRIFKDSSFIPREKWFKEFKQTASTHQSEIDEYKRVQERMIWPYTYNLVIENKGKAFDFGNFNDGQRLLYVIQLLKISRFMLSQGVVHTDMHKQNLLVQPNGNLALIDYGEVHFKGSKEFDDAIREHMMELQITALMSDSDNFYQLEDNQPREQMTTHDQRIRYFFKHEPQLVSRLQQITDQIGYGNPVTTYTNYIKENREPFLIISFAYDATKLTDRQGFLKMMNFPQSSQVHSWFTFDFLDVIYTNLGHIDKSIQTFEACHQAVYNKK
jgi:serine/threonine protein kinase